MVQCVNYQRLIALNLTRIALCRLFDIRMAGISIYPVLP